jgi:hypothetical protein
MVSVMGWMQGGGERALLTRRRAMMAAVVLAGGALVLAACGWWNLTTRTPPLVESRKAPSFTLPDQGRKSVSLDQLLEHGPAVVVFYRGHW